MPYKEKEITKMYWTTGEVAQMTGASHSQLRLWEKEFEFFNVKKNKKGDRFFNAKDIEHMRMIIHLLKEEGYTLKGAKEKLKNDLGKVEIKFDAVDSLKKIREFLVELKEQL